MMELSHSLTLNEEVLAQLPEVKRPVFVFEWLRFLDKVLVAAQKSDIKQCQKQLVEQLVRQMREGQPGPPSRRMLGRCLATLFSVGDTFLLFDAVNQCNDVLRTKDDSPSCLPARLAAITSTGAMYEKLGRMMGRSYEDTVHILLKSLRNAESQSRCETMHTMEKIVAGMGVAASPVHKDIFKAVRHCMTDRVLAVRCAAAKCLLEMVGHAPFLYTSELETVASICFRAFEGSNYEVRCTVARLLGTTVAITQQASQAQVGKNRLASLDEVLGLLASGFLRGGIGFLKGSAGEMIKGGSSVSREIRVGVTHAYVVLFQRLGGLWLERHLPAVLSHLLELVGHPRAVQTHVDAVYSRKCVSFALRSVLGKMLGDKAQAAACKDLVQLLIKHLNTDAVLDSNGGGGKEGQQEVALSQHILVCALQELGCLVETLGTTAVVTLSDSSIGLVETVVSVLVHTSPAARLAAAWCLRCVVTAVPSQLTPLLDRCLDQLESLKSSPEAIAGHSAALAALLGAARHTPLGLPHNKGKMIFNLAEDLLRSASQNSRLSLQRTQAGWLMMGAVMTLGPPVVRSLLPRMLLLWKNCFPRSTKELESEKVRGDAFTWQVTLEGRSGALSAMASFLKHCKELASDDIVRRILSPVESALLMLAGIGPTIKSYGQHLKASAAMVRLRLYETMSLLPAQSYESSYNHLLRLLVAEFTLTENPANTTTSLLRSLCHSDDSVILGSWLQETDHKAIEDQLQPNSASGSGALEHDTTALYRSLNKGEAPLPGPLPLGVAVIDASVLLYGLVFPHVAFKHRLQMLDHFSECVRHSKATRQEAVQINIFTALLSALKALAEAKASLGGEDVRKAAVGLIHGALSHPNPILRCAAGEALGRMAQVVGDGRFVAEMAQDSFDRLKTARDAVSRTGHSLALGCLHRYVGGMGSGQHLNTSVSILLALAQDMNAPVVQVWALHALGLIADSGGPMFRGYVEPTLSLALKLLLSMPPAHVDVHQCIGKCLSAVITTIGPELQGNTSSTSTARSSLLVACSIMQDHGDALVQTEAISCLQQLHMFAPRHVNLSSLVPVLCSALNCPHLLLRRAAVACLRQLSQREAREVCEHASSWAKENAVTNSGSNGKGGVGGGSSQQPQSQRQRWASEGAPLPWEAELPGVLFALLDRETDPRLVSHVHDCLTSMLQAMLDDSLAHWLTLCKDVLTAADTSASVVSAAAATVAPEREAEPDGAEDFDDDEEAIKAGEEPTSHPAVGPRWPTKVFAAESLHKIISLCQGNHRAHFDLALAREERSLNPRQDFLVLHLSDLVRMAFMAATSDSDPLRLEGLKTLQLIIDQFSQVPEPEFPGHVILEQYQAQVGAALRPAFSPETPSHVTAMACQVCSAWIGSGVARDLNDLRRVHQLLVSSLTKLQKGANSLLYNESASTLEKLAILKAWAEVYIVAMEKEHEKPSRRAATNGDSGDPSAVEGGDAALAEDTAAGSRESLLKLVAPELLCLSRYWLAALKDHALLSLPAEFSSQLPHDGGAFYTSDTVESARPHYRDAWPAILHAASLWLTQGGGFEGGLHREAPPEEALGPGGLLRGAGGVSFLHLSSSSRGGGASSQTPQEINRDWFHLLFGICMEALCGQRVSETPECVPVCLQALHQLLSHPVATDILGHNRPLSVELCHVLHRMLLARDSTQCQLMVMKVAKLVVVAWQESYDAERKQKLREAAPANQEPRGLAETVLATVGEGGEGGELVAGQSVVHALLEVCLCLLVRQLPQLSPQLASSLHGGALLRQGQGPPRPLDPDAGQLVAAALGVIADLPQLCSPAGCMRVVPTILFLVTSVLKEVAVNSKRAPASAASPAHHCQQQPLVVTMVPVNTALQALKSLALLPLHQNSEHSRQWVALLRSTLSRIIDFTKTSEETGQLDDISMLLAIALFVLNAPKEVVQVANLQYPCINLFKHGLLKEDTVQLWCVQTLRSIFQHQDRSVSTPYIHSLGPRVVETLLHCADHLGSTTAGVGDTRLNVALECLQTLEALLVAAPSDGKAHMMLLYVPVLVNLLLDPTAHQGASVARRKLHQAALGRLTRVGPQYPQEFRAVMGRLPQLRAKIESAVRSGSRGPDGERPETPKAVSTNHSTPSIKLKTDFSNFTG